LPTLSSTRPGGYYLNRGGGTLFGHPVVTAVDDLPRRKVDLAVVDSGAYDAVVHLGGGLLGFAGLQIKGSPLFPQQGLDLVADT
jgi:hypothetical protein